MEKTAITAHMIVRNEEQWVWYAINSVLPYIERILIYETGSTDTTVAIIKTIKNPKISFNEKGSVTPKQLVELRNEQIKKTTTEWFMLLDGDEVWPQAALQEHFNLINHATKKVMGIVVSARMCVGDLYHVQDDKAGKYELLGKKGHFNIRMYRKEQGYHWQGEYPLEAYVDEKGVAIQNSSNKLLMVTKSYWHLSYLKRSSVDTHGKRILEIGKRNDIKLPEVFFQKRPQIVPSPDVGFSPIERIIAYLRTPLLFLKRNLKRTVLIYKDSS